MFEVLLCEDEVDVDVGDAADGEATDDIELELAPADGLAIASTASVAFCVTTCWKLPPVLAADSKRLAILEAAAVPPVPIALLIRAIVDALSVCKFPESFPEISGSIPKLFVAVSVVPVEPPPDGGGSSGGKFRESFRDFEFSTPVIEPVAIA